MNDGNYDVVVEDGRLLLEGVSFEHAVAEATGFAVELDRKVYIVGDVERVVRPGEGPDRVGYRDH